MTQKPLEQPGDGSLGVQAATQPGRSKALNRAAPVPRVSVEHVAKAYVTRGLWPLVRRNRVLTDASLEIAAGEIAVIVGADASPINLHPSSYRLTGGKGTEPRCGTSQLSSFARCIAQAVVKRSSVTRHRLPSHSISEAGTGAFPKGPPAAGGGGVSAP